MKTYVEIVAKPKTRNPFAVRVARSMRPRRARSTYVPVRVVALSS
jgi:hypothetical protein